VHLQALRLERNARAFRPISITLAATVAATLTFSAAEGKTSVSPPITINGLASNVVALERDNSVFVPVRGVFEQLGATVHYSGSDAIVVRKGGSELVRLRLGSHQSTVNGVAHTDAVTPFSSQGRVMVPLRLISEAAGATVVYAATPRAISVTRAVAAAPQQVAQAAPAATDASNTAATNTEPASPGFPWWTLLLALLIIAALIWFFMSRRKKEPIITTSGSTPKSRDPDITTRR